MTTSSPGAGGSAPRPPFDPVHASGAGPAAPAADAAAPSGRRPPLWVIGLAAVLLAGLGVVAVLALSNRGGVVVVPEAEVITLPVPSPTIEAMVREPGTAFADALPSTVLQYALAESAPEPSLLVSGALEGYRLAYTDGGATTLVTIAGQWATPEEAGAQAAALVAAQVAAAGETETPVEEGPVLVGETEVGRYVLVTRDDGTGTITWTNGTVVLQIDGPAQALPDVHTAFPL